MEAIIYFTSSVLVKGEDLADIREKFEFLPLYSADATEDAGICFDGVTEVYDNNTKKNITDKFNEC